MTVDDTLKIKAALLYVIEKTGGLTPFFISKIFYFANEKHLARYGRAVINDDFCAMLFGPVPSFTYDALKIANGKNVYISDNHKIISDSILVYQGKIIKPKESPDMDELSKSDIECLDEAIKENIKLNFRELSSKSHDNAWKEAFERSNASKIDKLSMARSAGANEAMIEYIKENDNINNHIR